MGLHFFLTPSLSVTYGHVSSKIGFRCLDFEISTLGNIEKVKLFPNYLSTCAGTVSRNLVKSLKFGCRLNFGGGTEICLKFWNLVKSSKFVWESEIWSQSQNLVEFLKLGSNFWNWVKILKFDWESEIESNLWGGKIMSRSLVIPIEV